MLLATFSATSDGGAIIIQTLSEDIFSFENYVIVVDGFVDDSIFPQYSQNVSNVFI